MPDRLPPGPYRTLRREDGSEADFYIIPFDKRGLCEAPQTRRHLIDRLEAERAEEDERPTSDIFLFSHGWNNDWAVAIRRYEHFLDGFMSLRRQHALAAPEGYRPLLVGVFWPSTALVFGEKERGPEVAAGDPQAVDEVIAEERAQIREIAEDLGPEDAVRFFELAQGGELDYAEALELARLTRAVYQSGDDELDETDLPSAEEMVEVWAAEASADEVGDLGDFGTLEQPRAAGPQAAGLGSFFKKLDPRGPVRALTVYRMKDRAGSVGANGVGPLLRDLLRHSQARLHLVGHSFGGKVVLSATCAGAALPRKVHSMLLLQPAVNHLCFAENVPRIERPGGYRAALERVDKPILSTFSRHDVPLTGLFHRALRRRSDLGEQRIAAPGEPPSRYAALGGYGPRGCGERLVPILDPAEQRYELAAGVPVYGLQGDRTIDGHGDISNPSTWWALHNLIA